MSTYFKKAVIFDYDGLLFDTEDLWFKTCQELCAHYNVIIGEEHREELMRSKLSSYLIFRFSLPTKTEDLRPKLYATFDKLAAKNMALLPGAKYAIELLSQSYLLGVGTGSVTWQVEENLEKYNLKKYFKEIVGADQVEHGKPAPDIYLRVSEKLKVKPSDCLVLEDQPRGIRSAKEAGMKCIAVPNKYISSADFSEADLSIDSLDELTTNMVERLLNS